MWQRWLSNKGSEEVRQLLGCVLLQPRLPEAGLEVASQGLHTVNRRNMTFFQRQKRHKQMCV